MAHTWMTLDDFWQHCRNHPVSPLLRLLLSSDGSMVRSLMGLYLSPPALELIDQSERLLDDESSGCLGVPKGEKAIDRTVWLTLQQGPSGPTRVLFARSLFPIAKIKPNLYQEMRLGKLPLGEILESRALSTWRDQLHIACLPFPELAPGLGLAEDQLFWARRYRLTISGEISAIICEVLSPRLSSFSA